MKLTLIVLFLSMINGFAFTQTKEDFKKRNEAEKKTHPFDPQFNMKGDAHLSITFKFENGQLEPVKAEKVIGKLPYRSSENGEFKVEYANAEGKILGTFYENNPTIYRSCDEGGTSIQEVSGGTEITILLPYIKEIATISFTANNSNRKFTPKDIQTLMRGVD